MNIKTTLFSALAVCAFSASVNAADVSLTGGTTQETPASFDPSYDKTTVLTLLTSGGIAYFSGDNQTVNKISATADINSYFTSGFTIDTNAASGTAINYTTAGTANTITLGGNSTYVLDSSTTAPSGTTLNIMMQGNDVQRTSLVVESGSTLSAFGNVVYTGSATGAIETTAASGLMVNGTFNIYGSDDITSYGNLRFNWTVINSKGSRSLMNIGNGGVLNVNNITFGQFAVLQVANGGTVNATGTITLSGASNTSEGYLLIDQGGTVYASALSGTYGNGNCTLTVNGALIVSGAMNMTSTQTLAALSLSSTGSINAGSISLKGGAYTLNGAVTASSMSIDNHATTPATANSIGIGGTVNLGSLSITATTVGVTLSSGSSLNVTGATTIDNTQTAASVILANAGSQYTTGSLSLAGGIISASGGTITADSITFSNNATSTATRINVNGGTLNVGALNTTGATTSMVYVSNSGTANITGNSSVKSFTIESSVLNVKSGITTLNANNGLVLTGGAVMNIYDGATVAAAAAASYSVTISGTSTINVLGTSGLLDVSAHADGVAIYKTLTLNAQREKAVLAQKLTFYDTTSKLILSQKNTVASSASAFNTRIVMAASAVSAIEMNALQTFGELYFQANSKMTLTFGDEGAVIFTTLSNVISGNELIFTNFDNDKVFFTTMTSLSSALAFSGTDVYGNTLTTSDFSLLAGSYEGHTGYWLISSTVPEPAAWAAIFGAVALGFAAWRRRK